MTEQNKQFTKVWLIDQYITQGKSSTQIARESGCSPAKIQRLLHAYEIPIRGNSECHLKPDSQLLSNRDWLYDQYITKMKSASKIGKEIGCQQETVSRYLHKFNIPIRSQSEEIGGERHPLFGKHFSEESKLKMSLANTGHKASEETKKKISIATSGSRNPRFGVKLSQEQIDRQRRTVLKTYETNPEIKIMIGNSNRGERSGNWKGGISFEPYCPKFNKDLKTRVRAFFDYKCIICGKSTEENKKNLAVHHVEYDKSACCHGKPIHFAALCHKCHSKTNYNREYWERILHIIIDEIYNGRSYYTKEEYEDILKKTRRDKER